MKIREILSGTKKRKRRGSRLKRVKGSSLIKKLKEGGNIFPDSISFDHKMIPDIMKSINSVLAKTNSKAIPVSYTHLTLPTKRIV